ncbi:MAG: acetyl-CoA carboxylase carboxyltransferase subunit beta [Bacteroidetes bacterium]|nr:acetyl-CoA carboxylase carboxyltransferase subunit beta [Bacteroidota bacterium]
MSWYKRIKDGILTKTSEKKEAPEGVWVKCNNCQRAISVPEYKEQLYVCPDCDYHFRIGSKQYFQILFDSGKYKKLFDDIISKDFLKFEDIKKYSDRLIEAEAKTNLREALSCAKGKLNGNDLVIAAMDFSFIGGSMGSVVGEKISRSVDYCVEHKYPLLIISKSGGARMMESAFSLMQLAKTSAKLTILAKAKLPFISLLTDPTTGGVTASFAMLGDVNMAEPRALIGFAGPRVIKETIKKDLPEGFQTSEFLLEHGFVDLIVERKDLKQNLANLMTYFAN